MGIVIENERSDCREQYGSSLLLADGTDAQSRETNRRGNRSRPYGSGPRADKRRLGNAAMMAHGDAAFTYGQAQNLFKQLKGSIRTVCFDKDGPIPRVPQVADEVVTGGVGPTFGIVRPAVPNMRVDFSPDGQSALADAVDAVQSVDLAYDAFINEIDAGKMRASLSDVMLDQQKDSNGKMIPIPFGKGDCTVFRKVMSTEDMITEFAPALRTEAQRKAFRLALQVLWGSRQPRCVLLEAGLL